MTAKNKFQTYLEPIFTYYKYRGVLYISCVVPVLFAQHRRRGHRQASDYILGKFGAFHRVSYF